MGNAPAQVVAPIPRTPVPYGLMSVLTERTADSPHWQNGVTWESLGCAPASGIGEAVCYPTQAFGLPFNFPHGVPLGTANPFTIYDSFKCSAIGHDNPLEYARDRAVALLEAREVQRVEQAIWTGDLQDTTNGVGNPGFAPGATILNPGSPYSLRYAIGLLDKEITRTYGSQGVLHMSRLAGDVGNSDFSLDTIGGVLQTQLATPVVAGVGYNGLSPAGTNPGLGQTYIYATPAMFAYRSDVLALEPALPMISQSNDLEAVAQRTWLVGWDACPTLGVLVDLNTLA